MKKATPNWGTYFKIKKLGYNTFYIVLRNSEKTVVGPDFRSRADARRFIIANWKDIIFEALVLKDKNV